MGSQRSHKTLDGVIMNYALALKGAPMGNKNAAGPHTGHSKAPIADHENHLKDSRALRYIIQDAGTAAKNMRGWNDAAEAKYMDQMNDASTVLGYRQRNNLSDEEAINAAKAYQSKTSKTDFAQVLKEVIMDFSKILKANPYHGEGGMFSSADSATFVSTGEKFGKFLTRVQGTFHGPNRGGGYSGKVAAGLAKVLGERKNPDHKLVTGMKSHVVDTNARTREDFNRKRSDIHQVLTMNGFRQSGKEYTDRGTVERTSYDHPNGAAAVVEHEVQSAPGASKWIGTEIFHGQKAKKGDDQFIATVVQQLQSIAGPTFAQVLKGLSNPEVEVLDPRKKKVQPAAPGKTETTAAPGARVSVGASEVTVAGMPCSQGSY